MEESNNNDIFIERVAIALFAFMRQAGLNVSFGKQDALSFVYQIADITTDAQAIAVNFVLDLSFLSKNNVEDTLAGIEKFSYDVTTQLGNQLFNAKCNSLLQHQEKSKILLSS